MRPEPVQTETAQPEQPLRPRGDWPIWSRPLLLWVRLGYLTLLNAAFSGLYRFRDLRGFAEVTVRGRAIGVREAP